MRTSSTSDEQAMLARHVETWKRAGIELAEISRRELRAVDTQEAVRQLYGQNTLVQDAPKRTTSGLVEQQAWFAKLRRK